MMSSTQIELDRILAIKNANAVADELYLLVSGQYFAGNLLTPGNPERKAALTFFNEYTNAIRDKIEKHMRYHSTDSIAKWIDIANAMLDKGDLFTATIIQTSLKIMRDRLAKPEYSNLTIALDNLDEKRKLGLRRLDDEAKILTSLDRYEGKNVSVPYIEILTANQDRKKELGKDTKPAQLIQTKLNAFYEKTRKEIVKQRAQIISSRYADLHAHLQKYQRDYAKARLDKDLRKRDMCNKMLTILDSDASAQTKYTKLKKLLADEGSNVKHTYFHKLKKSSDTTIITYGKEMLKVINLEMINGNADIILANEKKAAQPIKSALFQPIKETQLEQAYRKVTDVAIILSRQLSDKDLQLVINTVTTQSHLVLSSDDRGEVAKAARHLDRIKDEIVSNPAFSALSALANPLELLQRQAAEKVAQLFNHSPSPKG